MQMGWQKLLLLLWTFLWVQATGSTLQQPRQIAEEELSLFGFSRESTCYTAASTMLNNVPFSCHSSLGQLLRDSNAPPLRVDQLRLDQLDPELCQIYCSYPLKQAAHDCNTLQMLHDIINAACLTNRNGTMCSRFQSSMDLLWEECNVTMTTNCTDACNSTMHSVNGVVGCCLATLLAVSVTDSPCSPPLARPCSLATHTLPLPMITTLALVVTMTLT